VLSTCLVKVRQYVFQTNVRSTDPVTVPHRVWVVNLQPACLVQRSQAECVLDVDWLLFHWRKLCVGPFLVVIKDARSRWLNATVKVGASHLTS